MSFELDEFESSFRGNENLKKKGTVIQWTPELMQEYIRCKNDIIYFAEKYVKFITLDHGFVNINLYDYQKEIVTSFVENRRTIVATSRQAGKTTTAAVLILHYILFNKEVKVGILANKADTAIEVLERIQLAYESLPLWLQQGVTKWSVKKIVLENKSQVIAAATSSSAIRGKTLNFVYIDECAFVERWDTFYSSVYPVLSSGKDTKILFTSTPSGLNHFYKFWEDAQKRDIDIENWNGFNPVLVTWQEVPGRDEEWAKDTLKALSFDKQKFAQEYEVEFQGSSGTLIAGHKLKTLVSRTPVLESEDGLKQYEYADKNKIYVMLVDVSRGKGPDYHAFHVIDVTQTPYNQVCTFRSNNIEVGDYADIVHKIAKIYNSAYVLVENNDIGAQVPYILWNDYEYENIIYTKNTGRLGKGIFFGAGAEQGVRTTKSVKAIGCSMIKAIVEGDKLTINDEATIKELQTFSKKGTSYEAEVGNNDDLVMGLVLFGWMSNEDFFKELTDLDILNNLREKETSKIEEEMLPFGFIQDGNEEMDIYSDFY